MQSYKKLANLRDETIFQIKKAKHMIKNYEEEIQSIRSDQLVQTYLNTKKAILLHELIKDLEKLYEIK